MSAATKHGLRAHVHVLVLGVLAAVGLALTGAVARADAPAAASAVTPAAAAAADPVIAWNQTLLGILNTPGAQPATVHATRSLAILHAAIYDAVDSIERTSRALPGLDHLAPPCRPDRGSGRRRLRGALESLPEPAGGDRRAVRLAARAGAGRVPQVRGGATGEAVAEALLALRADDGSARRSPSSLPARSPATTSSPRPRSRSRPSRSGRWFGRSRCGGQPVRPPAPPALTSKAYAAAFAEVKSLGAVDSATRTADETQIGQFWNPPIWVAWNNIAETAALAHHDTLMQNARLFALLNVTFADSVIAFYDAKYTYRFWRPVTAIRAADTGNPALVGDPNWTPLANTAQDPSYPGAHAVISSAAASVLGSFFGGDDFSVHGAVDRASRRRALVHELQRRRERSVAEPHLRRPALPHRRGRRPEARSQVAGVRPRQAAAPRRAQPRLARDERRLGREREGLRPSLRVHRSPALAHAASSRPTSRTAATPSASSTTFPTRTPPVSSSRFQVRP